MCSWPSSLSCFFHRWWEIPKSWALAWTLAPCKEEGRLFCVSRKTQEMWFEFMAIQRQYCLLVSMCTENQIPLSMICPVNKKYLQFIFSKITWIAFSLSFLKQLQLNYQAPGQVIIAFVKIPAVWNENYFMKSCSKNGVDRETTKLQATPSSHQTPNHKSTLLEHWLLF